VTLPSLYLNKHPPGQSSPSCQTCAFFFFWFRFYAETQSRISPPLFSWLCVAARLCFSGMCFFFISQTGPPPNKMTDRPSFSGDGCRRWVPITSSRPFFPLAVKKHPLLAAIFGVWIRAVRLSCAVSLFPALLPNPRESFLVPSPERKWEYTPPRIWIS